MRDLSPEPRRSGDPVQATRKPVRLSPRNGRHPLRVRPNAQLRPHHIQGKTAPVEVSSPKYGLPGFRGLVADAKLRKSGTR